MKNQIEWNCDTLDATRQAGLRLGASLTCGDVVALVGPLGSGKTTLTRAVAEGAGVEDLRQVNSPTFVIVNEYMTRTGLRIHHIDAYRLRDGADLEALGFEEMPETGAVILEWADRVEAVLPPDRLTLTLRPTGSTSRRLTLQSNGRRATRLLNASSADFT